MDFIIVGAGGFIGAILRYSLYLVESNMESKVPFATLFINLSGCLLAGGLLGLAARINPEYKHYITLTLIGLVGSYTTFSTFGVDSLRLIESHSFLWALLNIVLNIVGGIIMVWLGRSIVNAF